MTNGGVLRRGRSKSCGCLSRELAAERARRMGAANTRHGQTRSPEWATWVSMKQRCSDPNTKSWANYGGRGITMCAEWLTDFQAFFDHVGPKPADTSIDRIDNDRGYEPGNVRWATRSQQMRNRRPLQHDAHGRVTPSEPM